MLHFEVFGLFGLSAVVWFSLFFLNTAHQSQISLIRSPRDGYYILARESLATPKFYLSIHRGQTFKNVFIIK
jgi:hypothetical protein